MQIIKKYQKMVLSYSAIIMQPPHLSFTFYNVYKQCR